MPPAHALENAELNLFQGIVEQAPEAIIFADREGLIRIWNRGAEAVFGYSAGEVLGGSLDVIIPERFRRAHWEGYHKAIDAGRTRHGDRVMTTRSMHKDGSKLYVDLSFALVKDRAGVAIGAMSIGRNVTARYLADSALSARVRELEQKLKSGSEGGAGI